MASPRVLMTGATGSFGRLVAAELLERGCELVVLARGRDDMDSRRRVHEAIGFPQKRLRVIRGDVAVEDLGLSRAARAHARSADVVLHAAAATSYGLALDAARRVNFAGTRNVLALAHRIFALQKLVHVSAASVAGKRCGHILEPQLYDEGFVDAYERSKFEGERLVRAHSQLLPIAVVRPTIVADASRGLRRMLELPVLPAAPTTTLDLISAADAAAVIARIVLARGALGTFHIASGDRAPRLGDVVRVGTRRRVRFAKRDPIHGDVASFVETLAYPKTFDTARTEAALGRHPCSRDPLAALAESSARARSVIGV